MGGFEVRVGDEGKVSLTDEEGSTVRAFPQTLLGAALTGFSASKTAGIDLFEGEEDVREECVKLAHMVLDVLEPDLGNYFVMHWVSGEHLGGAPWIASNEDASFFADYHTISDRGDLTLWKRHRDPGVIDDQIAVFPAGMWGKIIIASTETEPSA